MVARGAPGRVLKSPRAMKGEPSHDIGRQAAPGPLMARKDSWWPRVARKEVVLTPAVQEERRARAAGGPQHPQRAPQVGPHGDRQGRKWRQRYWENFLQANTCATVQ